MLASLSMNKLIALSFLGFLTFSSFSSAADEAPKWAHESQAGVVLTTGNTDSQTYSFKQTTSYAWTGNLATLNARYLMGKSDGILNARTWSAGLRYERQIWEMLSGFGAYTMDGNTFSGIELRHAFDIGGKYYWYKTDQTVLFNELGYRYTTERLLGPSRTLNSHFGRLYAEWSQNWNKSFSSKVFVEYLPNFSNTDDYQANAEPSLSMILTDIFSVKLAYLMQYRNLPPTAGKKRLDTTYTTSLVAKF